MLHQLQAMSFINFVLHINVCITEHQECMVWRGFMYLNTHKFSKRLPMFTG